MASKSESNDQIVTSERLFMKWVSIEMSLFELVMHMQCRLIAKRNHSIYKDTEFHKVEKSEVGELLKSHTKSAKTKKSCRDKTV